MSAVERETAAALATQRVVNIDDLKELQKRCHKSLNALRNMGMAPETDKRLLKHYRPARVADMLGFSRTKIAKAINELGLQQALNKATDRPIGFTLADINKLRDHLDCRPSRRADEQCVRLAIQSFKGGVSKSVTSVYFAQYLAEKGYRVLLIDCDPQASATSSFGYVPDLTFTAKDTLDSIMRGHEETLHYAIRKTYFDGLDLVPSCLALQELDFALFNAVANAGDREAAAEYYRYIADAVDSVEDDYDVIIMDSAPNLSMMSINILLAANAVIVPAPPALYDFSSTTQYIEMVVRVVEKIDDKKLFKFLKVMPARVDRSKPKQIQFLTIMSDIVGKFLTQNKFYSASAIPDTASAFQTVFDQQKPDARVIKMLQEVFGEIELEVQLTWPSKHEQLREQGVLV